MARAASPKNQVLSIVKPRAGAKRVGSRRVIARALHSVRVIEGRCEVMTRVFKGRLHRLQQQSNTQAPLVRLWHARHTICVDSMGSSECRPIKRHHDDLMTELWPMWRKYD